MTLIEEIPLQLNILLKASDSFPTIIKTLDSLHLATALSLKEKQHEDLVFVTHDKQQGIAAMACGMEVQGV